jgi:hypothetical protein
MNEQNKKPLILELDDAKKEFVRFINDLQSRGLPCYLIEMAISEPLMQIRNVAKTELDMARKQIEIKE